MTRPPAPKITDLDTAFDALPVETAKGPVVWATVTMQYLQDGLTPSVVVRVPVPWKGPETAAMRHDQAVRCARQVIEHACRAAGVSPAEPDETAAQLLEGISQELGLAEPRTRARRR